MISKFVLAGGPGAGKSKSLLSLQKRLSEKGYTVYVIQETARDLIESGIERSSPDFPYYNFSLMLYKELMFEKVAKLHKENAIILCDRGRMDPKAYRGKEVFDDILHRNKIQSEKEVINSYDGVVFLQTAADGLESEYINDKVRIENVPQAVESQQKLLDVWQEHPKFRFIHNAEDFDEKVENIERTILDFIHQKSIARLSAKELIEYADGLSISNEEILKMVEQLLLDKKIIKRNISFEH